MDKTLGCLVVIGIIWLVMMAWVVVAGIVFLPIFFAWIACLPSMINFIGRRTKNLFTRSIAETMFLPFMGIPIIVMWWILSPPLGAFGLKLDAAFWLLLILINMIWERGKPVGKWIDI